MPTTAVCKLCADPLVVEVEVEEGGENADPRTVPDDLELVCGCHFHWQCLLDQSADVTTSLTCPSCQSALAGNGAGPSATSSSFPRASGASILTRYTNEGGVQEGLDILPAITEEAYLAANPQARPARAFHLMCGEGDVDGIVDLLRDVAQEDEDEDDGGEQQPELSPAQLIRYQDPLANMKSGLHIAVEQEREEVVWLLLWVASPLRTDAFPAPLREIAQAMALERPFTSLSDDIRALEDDRGRTAEAIAAEQEGSWLALLQANVLHPSSS
ncbi:putative ring finger-like protein [Rosellinia necatrix]|uniref:Putative ring finger-like protein n=1 Tax=Rosellinia necatrix TaxID=77044 RepID=A0A1W2TCZ0_ROSNE|nr:putative ring finger-like protein [Rosellinia necatrix]